VQVGYSVSTETPTDGPYFLIDYPVALARCICGGDHVPLSACGCGQYKRKTILNGWFLKGLVL